MKNLLALIAVLTLSGCFGSKTPPGVDYPTIPDLPPELSVKAEKLPPIKDSTMGNLVLTLDETTRAYNDKAYQVNDLIEFYDCVKVSINTKKLVKDCVK